MRLWSIRFGPAHLLVLLIVIILWLGQGASAFNHKYAEDFNSTQYRDILNNTAMWDTIAGELGMAPFQISLAGTYDSPGTANDVVVIGDYAFIADGTGGLRIVNISDPASPSAMGTYDTPGDALGVAVSGNFAYIADGSSGLVAVDISNLISPVLGSTLSLFDDAYDVCVDGDFAFVAEGDTGLAIVDIRWPDMSMSVRRRYMDMGSARGVAVSGDVAYVADLDSGLVVLDVSDPMSSSIVHLATYPLAEALDVAVYGDLAFVANGASGLAVFDVREPFDPVLLSQCAALPSATGVFVSGNEAYVADGDSGLVVIDISDPESPALMHSLDLPGTAAAVTVAGDHAFVATGEEGFAVVAVREFVSISQRGILGGTTSHLEVQGDHIFAVGSTGIRAVDISDPFHPVQLGSIPTSSSVNEVDVEGNHAYIAEGGRLRIVDVSEPLNLTQVGNYFLGNAYGVDVEGDCAYVADYGYGLRVIDISDPAFPSALGVYSTGGSATDVAVDGDHAYLTRAGGPYVLYVLDVTNPAAPSLVTSATLPAYPLSITVDGDRAYVGMANVLYVYDISNPSAPTPKGSIGHPSGVTDIHVDGDYLFAGVSGTGMFMYDVSNPSSAAYLGMYSFSMGTFGVRAAGDLVYCANGSPGISVLQAFQRSLDRSTGEGWSMALNETADTIRALRLDALTSGGTVNWEYSSSGGAEKITIVSGSGWWEMDDIWSESGLIWISDHIFGYGDDPVATHLEIEWLYDFASIDDVEDIPGDQGGQARLSWTRSWYDEVGSAVEITGYAVYRRVDMPSPAAPATDPLLVDPVGRQLLSYPPGDWDYVMTVPARQEDYYSVVVPTLADSTIDDGMRWSTYFISALTPSVYEYYDSYPDSGWSVDNLAPYVPLGFALQYNSPAGNDLTWDAHTDEDFQYFRIYRGGSEDFVPGPGNLVHMTTGDSWNDPVEDGYSWFYKISAVDFSGNESEATGPAVVTGGDMPELPDEFALHQNVPNPFNPVTRIFFDMPSAGEVSIEIYDVSGRLVRKLAGGSYPAGRHEVAWNGVNETGAPAASGIYFCRMVTGRFADSRKMILLR
jgi:hypothetical protein